MSILNKIATERGTDKRSEIHDYCRKYEKYLPFKVDENITILEIGILDGESLLTWKDYFFNAKIVGIDINPICKQYENINNNIHVEIGSQYDTEFLKYIGEKYGPFDMILDDGSHINKHVIFSFKELFKYVKSKGVYIVEDVCTSYWEEYEGGRYKENTTIEYFKNVVDEVNFFGEYTENYGNWHARRDDHLLEQFEKKGYNYIGTQIESLNFLNSIIIATKR